MYQVIVQPGPFSAFKRLLVPGVHPCPNRHDKRPGQAKGLRPCSMDRAFSHAASYAPHIHKSRDGTGTGAPILSVLNDYSTRWSVSPGSFFGATDPAISKTFTFVPLRSMVLIAANIFLPWAQLTHLQIQEYISCRTAEIIFILRDLVAFSLRALQCLPMLVHRLSLPSIQDIRLDNRHRTTLKPFYMHP